jgi:hypothetical protein
VTAPKACNRTSIKYKHQEPKSRNQKTKNRNQKAVLSILKNRALLLGPVFYGVKQQTAAGVLPLKKLVLIRENI